MSKDEYKIKIGNNKILVYHPDTSRKPDAEFIRDFQKAGASQPETLQDFFIRLAEIRQTSISFNNKHNKMSLFHDLLQEQINLLKEKGFEEKLIDSPYKEGLLFTQLRQEFSNALHQSLREDEPTTFQIATVGFFNNDKDIVHISFSYEFVPANNNLSLKEIEFIHNDNQRKLSINSPQDIPHSSQALLIFTKEVRTQRNRAARQMSGAPGKQQNKIR